MTAAPLCYDGSGRRSPELLRVQAGPLTAFYSAGELRYVRWGEREIARRIYVAVRDRNWGTVPPVVADEDLDVRADRFRLRFIVRHHRADIDFAWLGDIAGEPDGAITFAMQGQARARFWRNRIGFCLLHPPREAAGPASMASPSSASRATSAPIVVRETWSRSASWALDSGPSSRSCASSRACIWLSARPANE